MSGPAFVLIGASLLAVVLAGCSSADPARATATGPTGTSTATASVPAPPSTILTSPTTTPSSEAGVDDLPPVGSRPPPQAPPPIEATVRSFMDEIQVQAWSWCWDYLPDECSQGAAPDLPPDVATDGTVVLEYPLPGWEFTGELCFGGAAPCMDTGQVELERIDEDEWLLELPDPDAMWAVTVHGEGPEGTLTMTFVTLPGGSG